MKSNRLIERAEVYEGIARVLRSALEKRAAPQSESAKRATRVMLRKALEAENTAKTLRIVAKAREGLK